MKRSLLIISIIVFPLIAIFSITAFSEELKPADLTPDASGNNEVIDKPNDKFDKMDKQLEERYLNELTGEVAKIDKTLNERIKSIEALKETLDDEQSNNNLDSEIKRLKDDSEIERAEIENTIGQKYSRHFKTIENLRKGSAETKPGEKEENNDKNIEEPAAKEPLVEDQPAKNASNNETDKKPTTLKKDIEQEEMKINDASAKWRKKWVHHAFAFQIGEDESKGRKRNWYYSVVKFKQPIYQSFGFNNDLFSYDATTEAFEVNDKACLTHQQRMMDFGSKSLDILKGSNTGNKAEINSALNRVVLALKALVLNSEVQGDDKKAVDDVKIYIDDTIAILTNRQDALKDPKTNSDKETKEYIDKVSPKLSQVVQTLSNNKTPPDYKSLKETIESLEKIVKPDESQVAKKDVEPDEKKHSLSFTRSYKGEGNFTAKVNNNLCMSFGQSEDNEKASGIICFFYIDVDDWCHGNEANCISQGSSLEREFKDVSFEFATATLQVDPNCTPADSCEKKLKHKVAIPLSFDKSPNAKFNVTKFEPVKIDVQDQEDGAETAENTPLGKALDYDASINFDWITIHKKKSIKGILYYIPREKRQSIGCLDIELEKYGFYNEETYKDDNKISLFKVLNKANDHTIFNLFVILKRKGSEPPLRKEMNVSLFSSGQVAKDNDLPLEKLKGGVSIQTTEFKYFVDPDLLKSEKEINERMHTRKIREKNIVLGFERTPDAKNQDFFLKFEYMRYFKPAFKESFGLDSAPFHHGISFSLVQPKKRKVLPKTERRFSFKLFAEQGISFSDWVRFTFHAEYERSTKSFRPNLSDKNRHELSVTFSRPKDDDEDVKFFLKFIYGENGLTHEKSEEIWTGIDASGFADNIIKKLTGAED